MVEKAKEETMELTYLLENTEQRCKTVNKEVQIIVQNATEEIEDRSIHLLENSTNMYMIVHTEMTNLTSNLESISK